MVQKVFITSSGKAKLTCPECGNTKQIDVNKHEIVKKKTGKLKVKCPCSHSFSVIFERRHHVRKAVDFPGNLVMGNKKYPINVTDISRMGLKIRTKGLLDLNIGDKVTIEFALDDPGRSKVSKVVFIRKIEDINLGVEFASSDHYDKFGPYLLFHLK